MIVKEGKPHQESKDARGVNDAFSSRPSLHDPPSIRTRREWDATVMRGSHVSNNGPDDAISSSFLKILTSSFHPLHISLHHLSIH